MRRFKALIFILSAGAVLCACSARTMAINTTVTMPAGSDEAARLRQVAVMPMPTPSGQNFSGEVESVLSSVKVDDKPYYTLVDRSALDKVMAEMNLSGSGMTDPATAASIGKLVGAKGIYTGSVTDSHNSTSNYTELRYYTECGAYSYVTGPYNSQIPVCVSWVQKSYPVSCIRNSAVFSFSIKLIEVETGLVVYASNPSSVLEDSGCSDQRAPSSGDQLLVSAKTAAINVFRNDIAPYNQGIRLGLIIAPEGIDKSKKAFLQGVEYAQGGRMDRACQIWKSIENNEKKSFALMFDLGACSETVGDLDGALLYYNAADSILGKPDNMVTSSMNRVRNMMENKKKLEKQKQN